MDGWPWPGGPTPGGGPLVAADRPDQGRPALVYHDPPREGCLHFLGGKREFQRPRSAGVGADGGMEVPFGMGKYHGRWGFEAFTNAHGVLYHSPRIAPGVRYPPYSVHHRERALESELP
jgi:hypothetical protein